MPKLQLIADNAGVGEPPVIAPGTWPALEDPVDAELRLLVRSVSSEDALPGRARRAARAAARRSAGLALCRLTDGAGLRAARGLLRGQRADDSWDRGTTRGGDRQRVAVRAACSCGWTGRTRTLSAKLPTCACGGSIATWAMSSAGCATEVGKCPRRTTRARTWCGRARSAEERASSSPMTRTTCRRG